LNRFSDNENKTMKKTVCRLVLGLALATLADAALAYTDGEKAVAAVGERLRTNDCDGAVKALNTGLQADYKEVALLAGTMFEAGFCVNQNWSKAIGFYTQAYDGGMREGALRLAAGFAAAANGPDTAAALWWAKRAGLAADYCTARLPDTDDPDRFVEALRLWRARKSSSFLPGVPTGRWDTAAQTARTGTAFSMR
jgi:TPR repeat protein